jgi:hypothetical protein
LALIERVVLIGPHRGYGTAGGTAMTTTQQPPGTSATGSFSPAQAFGLVLDAAVGSAAAKLERKTARWITRLEAVAGKDPSADAFVGLADEGLDAVAASGGVAQQAGAEGVKARVHGKSPAWAAIRGLWQAGSPAVRAAIVTSAVASVVLLLLSPALLLVYLLSLLVIAAVQRARSSRQQPPAPASR